MKTIEAFLRAYSVSALAAGVGAVALAESASAKVVITTNISIPVTYGMTLDLNNDGVPDIQFKIYETSGRGFCDGVLTAYTPNVNGFSHADAVIGSGSSASALARSAKVGASRHFVGYGVMVKQNCGWNYPYNSGTVCTTRGKWDNVPKNRFLGVRFKISGKVHYGWVRVTVPAVTGTCSRPAATITEYGYETIAGKMLKAGVPSNQSLGSLALGSDGLELWRNEKPWLREGEPPETK